MLLRQRLESLSGAMLAMPSKAVISQIPGAVPDIPFEAGQGGAQCPCWAYRPGLACHVSIFWSVLLQGLIKRVISAESYLISFNFFICITAGSYRKSNFSLVL